MRKTFALLPVLFLGACSLISPYSITFTNTPGEVVNPDFSTLDIVVSAPTLAYISGVSCEGAEPLELLPVVNKDMTVGTVHKLTLGLMKDQPAGSTCEVTVTAYDKTTTEQASESIEVKMAGELAAIPETPVRTPAKEGEMCAGIAGFQCEEGLTCQIADPTIADASGTCVKPTEATPAPEVVPAPEPELSPAPEATPEETPAQS